MSIEQTEQAINRYMELGEEQNIFFDDDNLDLTKLDEAIEDVLASGVEGSHLDIITDLDYTIGLTGFGLVTIRL